MDIINKDCLEGLKSLSNDTIDCVVTSPPYNKGTQVMKTGNQIWKGFKIAYDSYSDDMLDEDYKAWMAQVLDELYRVIKPDGSVFFNHKVVLRDNIAHFPDWILKSKFNLRQMIIWNRMCSSNMRQETFYPTYELIFWLTKGKPKTFKHQTKYQNDIWNIVPDRNNKHPAPFPFDVADNCIAMACENNSSSMILDPFTGSGTTAVAAKSRGHNFIGFEISKEYIKMAQDRVAGIITTKDGFKQECFF